MAKTSGLGTSFVLDDTGGSPVTFPNDVGTITLDLSQALQEVSGIDVDGTERITLRGDWSASISGFWEDGGVVLGVFGDIRNSRTLSVPYPGRTFGGECVIATFADAIGADGSDGWTATLNSSDGVFPTLT